MFAFFLALVLALAPSAFANSVPTADSLVGTWEGTLTHPSYGCGKVELRISDAKERKFSGRIDVDHSMVKANDQKVKGDIEGNTLTFAPYIDRIAAQFSLALNEGRNEMTGKVTRGATNDVRLVKKGNGGPVPSCQ